MVEPDFTDQTLRFGSMSLGPGHAFLLGEGDAGTRMGKSWEVREGRTFLIERASYPAIQSRLAGPARGARYWNAREGAGFRAVAGACWTTRSRW
jgi:hypothetical protein